jgi:Zn-dependent metalloprotease
MSDALRHPVHCYLPPHALDELARSDDPELRDIAIGGITAGAAARRARIAFSAMPIMAAIPSAAGDKHRLVYDMGEATAPMPGGLVREEGHDATGDEAADEAYDGAGATYDFYSDVHGRNSLDDQGMVLKSLVHYGSKVPNAFWDGEQMLYGDGDGRIFGRFTKSPEVIAHELTHGVIQYEANLEYHGEPGALNESFADVMAMQVEQRIKGQSAEEADWWLGGEILLSEVGAQGIRSFTAEKAYENNRFLGTDPQPKHMDDKYKGSRDYGGVHINSGIPNHAFYLVATELGGNSWERAGTIWYKTLRNLNRYSKFAEAAAMTIQVATADYGADSQELRAVTSAWETVGVEPA